MSQKKRYGDLQEIFIAQQTTCFKSIMKTLEESILGALISVI